MARNVRQTDSRTGGCDARWIKRVFIILVICSAIINDCRLCAATAMWSYSGKTGPKHWCRLFPEGQCCGDLQSPIDITTGGYKKLLHDADSQPLLDRFRLPLSEGYGPPRPPPLQLIGYGTPLFGINVTNNGLTVQLTMGGAPAGPPPMLTGGLLRGNFMFESAHFHWGKTSKTGSEHTLDGQRYPMEVHLVHRNILYESEEEARYHSDGFAVIAAFFSISHQDNRKLKDLVRTLTSITFKDESTALPTPLLLDAILPSERDDYIMYWGSETTPPCSQSVIWIMFEDIGYIGSRQIKAFRNLRRDTAENDPDYKKALVNNYRPIQPSNFRPLFKVERD